MSRSPVRHRREINRANALFLHHSHVLTIRGDGYRLLAKHKSGLIKTPKG